MIDAPQLSPVSKRLRIALALGLLALAAACAKKEPGGQVVAVVNGEEVTRRDLAAEPQASGLPDSDDAQPALGAMLNGVIDRKLAVAEARRLELDRTPQYLEQAKRLDEVMLSRTLFDRWAADTPQPDQRTIADFIARNPQRFDGRKLFLVDRIETTMDRDQTKALAPLASNDAIAAYLDSRSQAYRRTRTVIDSATVPLPFYRRLVALKPGDPLALVQDPGLIALAVVETRDEPLPASERQAEAVKALKQLAVQQKLAGLRKAAAIAYQPGYRPTPATGSKAAAAPASVAR
jgi:EpsD family peptidyl-prolyl cis-trans isomerase